MEFKDCIFLPVHLLPVRINRNIMEFKDTKEQVEANLMLRINRNIMEFKDFLIISAFLVAFTN